MTTATKVRRRDLQSALSKWIEERAPDGLVLIPRGFEYDSTKTDAFALWSMSTERMGQPRNTRPLVSGAIRLDVYWSRFDTASLVLGQQKLKRGPEIEDEITDLFELENVLVFNLADWEAGTPTLGSLASPVTNSDTSIPLVSAFGFPASGEVVIGAERISYSAISVNTLTGATRGVGQTVAFAHEAAKGVASELGAEIAAIMCHEVDCRPLGWDVVAQRERSLMMIPFVVSYDEA